MVFRIMISILMDQQQDGYFEALTSWQKERDGEEEHEDEQATV